ncbi:MAG: flagellar hook-basal body complex protein FliE [Planctomycetes bacterium]|nr:flagellar hook-basal body complex protein FliE [Planctomycetota bacterium]
MVDNIQNSNAVGRSAPAGNPGKTTNSAASPVAAGAAFQALLERLETHARELEAQSQSVESRKDLTGAVDRAHASLQDALSLSDRLVEAYREALTRNQAAPAAGVRPSGQAGKP